MHCCRGIAVNAVGVFSDIHSERKKLQVAQSVPGDCSPDFCPVDPV